LHEIGSNQAQGGLDAVVPSFGERLKKEREKRGMTLEDVSGATKISVRNLRALEQEKFDQMPGGIFNRGFVRAFAKHLGLDDDQVVADYMEAAGESVPTLDPSDVPAPGHTAEKVAGPPSSAPQESSGQVPWAALIGLVVLGTIALGFWSYHSHRKTSETSALAVEPAPGGRPAEASSLTPDAAMPPGGRADANTAPTSGSPPSPGTQSAPAGPPASGFDLALRAHDEVWLSSAVDGKPPSEAIMEDGQSITVHASDRAILKVGNAGALDVVFNGQRVPVRAAEGEVRTLTFTAAGLQVQAAAAPKPN
jgi:transcriptional regulator with XRE-family HTH domain